MEFQKVEPSADEVKTYREKATRVVLSRSRHDLVKLLALLMVENHCLTEEINIHREARGIDLLPTYTPKL